MNILFICDEYPPGKNGGIGAVTRALARGVVAAGHRAFVAGLYAPGYGQKDYEEDQGVKVWRRRFGLDTRWIGNDYSLKDTLLMVVLCKSGLMRWDACKSARKFHSFILEIIEEQQIDIVEWPDFNEVFRYLPPAFSWPSLPVPLVIKFHGTPSYIRHQLQQEIDPDAYLLEKRQIGRGDALIAVSRNTANNYSLFYDIDKPIEVLYNSIEIQEKPDPGKRQYRGDDPDRSDDRGQGGQFDRSDHPVQTIVFAGALTPAKGIYSLLEAWNIVFKNYPGARLRIFGKGKIKPLLAKLTDEARKSVQFEGFVTKDELIPALSGAAAAIFPSYAECFAMAPLEAMAAGCPVIYTRRASGPELIRSGINGLLADPDNYAEMADSMMRLLESKALRETFSEKARQTLAERFDIRKSVQDHLRFYEKQIGRTKA